MRIESIVLAAGILSIVGAGWNTTHIQGGKSQADKLFARAKADDYMGDAGCVDCHKSKVEAFHASPHAAVVADPKLPQGKHGCEGCHGPGYIHQAEKDPEVISYRKMPAAEASAACLRCHETTMKPGHWKGTPHAQANVSCVTCHQIHPDSEPNWVAAGPKAVSANDPRKKLVVARRQTKSLLMADEPTLCGQCHTAQVAQFKLSSHHPVPEGKLACSDCHSVHPTKNEAIHRTQGSENCATCHPEKAGPFVYEHDPVGSGLGEGCVECHKPHGSHNPKLLGSFSRGLCAQCHTDKLAEHFPGRTCWNAGCHEAVHGSNSSPHFLTP